MFKSAIIALFALGCQAPAAPAPVHPAPPAPRITPSSAADSTFRIEAYYDDEKQWSGTAWIVANNDGNTQLVTAGHVCDDEADAVFTEKHYVLIDRAGTKALVTHDVSHTYPEPDLCLVETAGIQGIPLPIAPLMPEYGDAVAYAGAPLGIYGDGIAPFYVGNYVGGNMVTVPTAGGASGSAMFTSNGVFGVLVSRMIRFESATYVVTLGDLKEFLSKAGI